MIVNDIQKMFERSLSNDKRFPIRAPTSRPTTASKTFRIVPFVPDSASLLLLLFSLPSSIFTFVSLS